MLEEKVGVIAVQETHTTSAESLRRRRNLTGFTLVRAVVSMELLRTSVIRINK
jgi:hypothetical protein